MSSCFPDIFYLHQNRFSFEVNQLENTVIRL